MTVEFARAEADPEVGFRAQPLAPAWETIPAPGFGLTMLFDGPPEAVALERAPGGGARPIWTAEVR